ncbi:MAG TPA: PepSY-like domain-containing protein [Flavisolibacter sp.]|nr:PepSY-like domain-containing protein [Flavisolibacter sp.]
MKRLLSVIATVVVLASCSTRSTTSTSANNAYGVPGTIQNGFAAQYPSATDVVWGPYDVATTPIDWELSGWSALDANDYVVQFNLGSDRYYAWYDADGTWIGSAYAMPNASGLPYAVNRTISSQFAGYNIESVQREMWKDRTAYEIKLKNGDNKVKLLVDSNGNILKQKNKD